MRKSQLYWTKEKCLEEALKYDTISEFRNKSGGAYYSSRTNKWLVEICSHLIGLRKPNNYWNKERCHDEALKYETRNEFQKKSRSAYTASRKNSWIEDVCSHMRPKENLLKRFIYSFEFSDNHVYVGLSYNIETRRKIHLGLTNKTKQSEKSAVFSYIKKTRLMPILNILTKMPINEEFASKEEKYYIKEYKNNNWILLNKIKGGGLGYGVKKWTKEKIKNVALKYDCRIKFKKESSGAYNAALKSGVLNEVCSHINKKTIIHWTKETAHNEALKYNNTTDFIKNSMKAYRVARKNGYFNEITSHMKTKIGKNHEL
jgi:hypothetical protein